MASNMIKPGVEHLPQGATGYYRISNTWALALKAGAMTVGALALANFLAINSSTFDVSIRNVARCTQMSRTAVQAAMGNLVNLRLADPVMNGNHCVGYRVYLSRQPHLAGLDLMPSTPDDGLKKEPETALIPVQDGFNSTPHIKTPLQDSSSLRSSVRLASAVPASAKPLATIETGKDGQSGFSFNDDQGVIPEIDIQRIMVEMRRANIKGDPDDYELRDFITSRIAFMTAPSFKGKQLVRGDKDTAQANRNRVMTFCMRIIDKPDFKWSSKRVDPSLRKKADEIREQIATLTKSSASYRMQDGSIKTVSEFSAIALDLQSKRDDMIKARIMRRPSSHTSASWKNYLGESFTIEVVAKYHYGDNAPAHLPAEEDRAQRRRQIAELQAELSALV